MKAERKARKEEMTQKHECYWCCDDEASLCLHSRDRQMDCPADPVLRLADELAEAVGLMLCGRLDVHEIFAIKDRYLEARKKG